MTDGMWLFFTLLLSFNIIVALAAGMAFLRIRGILALLQDRLQVMSFMAISTNIMSGRGILQSLEQLSQLQQSVANDVDSSVISKLELIDQKLRNQVDHHQKLLDILRDLQSNDWFMMTDRGEIVIHEGYKSLVDSTQLSKYK